MSVQGDGDIVVGEIGCLYRNTGNLTYGIVLD